MTNHLKSYPPTWKGELLLACRKCQRKLKGETGERKLVKLKKAIKQQNKEHPDRKLHLVSIPCLNLCPKGGITVCLPAQRPPLFTILRTEVDIEKLYSSD